MDRTKRAVPGKRGNSRRGPLLGRRSVPAAIAANAYKFAKPAWRIASARLRPGVEDWSDHGLHAAWLGHSTVLLRIDGFTILTDPIFSLKAGVHLGPVSLGVRRLIRPPLAIKDLPPIDLVLLSHAHMDHFDLPSLRALRNSRTEVITASGTSDLLRSHRYKRVRELGWNESARAGAAMVQAVEVRHWGTRRLHDTWRGYNGYLISAGRYRILFAGDTALTDSFRENRLPGGVHLALMPIGAYNPWIGAHCNPEQAWTMGEHAGAEFILPIHHQTFALGREPRLEPLERLLTAAGHRESSVALREVGQEFHLAV